MTEASSAHVAEQFADADQQHESATLGMWTFLATEVLFFGVLFVSYTICRLRWPEAFRAGSLDLKWYLGAINTAVLLGSSFMMALAVRAAALGDNRAIVRALLCTIGLAVLFLGIKGTEYYIEYREQLIPWLDFSTRGQERQPQEELFMTFYFTMTAIHATHMLIGIGIMLVLIWMTRRGKFSKAWHTPIEMTGLYWHFVDIVWVFLFPALYLLRNT
jgi:cytochrome c oxidase subunit III